MSARETPVLLVGEVFVDFTILPPGQENKLRLGGIAHAARGFWALNAPFRVAAILPKYLESLAATYFKKLGCVDFQVIGDVEGAPNVTAIFDSIEVGDQGYETLLRNEKSVALFSDPISSKESKQALIFPGSYELHKVCELLPTDIGLNIDIAYDVESPASISNFPQPIETIFISTSSELFVSLKPKDINDLLDSFSTADPETLILKENRGGARLISKDKALERLPAQLGTTMNSVGVGDVFAAAYLVHLSSGAVEAGWRANYAAAAYSQTTFPDLFKTYVQRDLKLQLSDMRDMWGSFIPWESRQNIQIYFAAPDFSWIDRTHLDQALNSLSYHNFRVRRPVVENGELPSNSSAAVLKQTYQADCDLLYECDLVFAVPLQRDPGTLVEIGLAIANDIPVVVFDPEHENQNTMVIAGSFYFSDDLDGCLNAVFSSLGKPRGA